MRTLERNHVIVTGAAGFIGAACVREFLSRGWLVSAICHRRGSERKATGLDRLREFRGEPGLAVASASVTDLEDLVTVLSQRIEQSGGRCRALVHCAGRATDVGWDRRFREANLEGVENVCHAVGRLGVERLVHLSTTDVYGVRDFSGADERTPLENNRRNPYAKYKILAEAHIRRVLPPGRFVILRPALVWGPGDATVLPRALAFLRSSSVIVHFGRWRGRNCWPLAFVGNVALVAYAAATNDAALGEAYNVVDPESTTMEEYYRLLIDRYLPAKRGMRSVTIPLPLAWPAAALSTGLSAVLGRDHPVFDPSLYGLRHVSHDQRFSGEKAARLLKSSGLRFVDRASALEQMRLGASPARSGR